MAGRNKVSRIFWRTYRRVPLQKLPNHRRSWLLDTGSLTKRLIKKSGGDFRVRVCRHEWARPSVDEARVLKAAPSRFALIREVELVCHGEVWVRARSIIPANTLRGAERELAILGERPLGEFLFKAKTMRRGPLQIAMIPQQIETGKRQFINARRSVFYLHEKPLLVSEYFLEALFSATLSEPHSRS